MSKDKQNDSEVDILSDLDEVDKAIIRYKIDGIKDVEIAKKVGRSRSAVYNRLQKVKVQQAIDELQKSALQILIDSQNEAARTLRQIMRKGSDDNKIKASKEILKGVLSDKVTLNFDNDYNEVQKELDDLREKVLNEKESIDNE